MMFHLTEDEKKRMVEDIATIEHAASQIRTYMSSQKTYSVEVRQCVYEILEASTSLLHQIPDGV